MHIWLYWERLDNLGMWLPSNLFMLTLGWFPNLLEMLCLVSWLVNNIFSCHCKKACIDWCLLYQRMKGTTESLVSSSYIWKDFQCWARFSDLLWLLTDWNAILLLSCGKIHFQLSVLNPTLSKSFSLGDSFLIYISDDCWKTSKSYTIKIFSSFLFSFFLKNLNAYLNKMFFLTLITIRPRIFVPETIYL